MKLVMKRILLLFCGLSILGLAVLAVWALGSLSQPDATQAELQAAFSSGKLVLVAFYSKDCPYCKADEPVLETLQTQFEDYLIVVRVNVESQFGKQLAQQVGVRDVPSYFLIDSVTQELIYQQEGPLQVDRMLLAVENGEMSR